MCFEPTLVPVLMSFITTKLTTLVLRVLSQHVALWTPRGNIYLYIPLLVGNDVLTRKEYQEEKKRKIINIFLKNELFSEIKIQNCLIKFHSKL